MKYRPISQRALQLGAFLITLSALAEVEFDLSPVGISAGLGLSPLNEFNAGCPECGGDGSGDEMGNGILFNPATLQLSFEIGYGSAAGFSDLTDAAFAWYLHGPATTSETGEILFDLSAYHQFADDPTQGGLLTGTIDLSPNETDILLDGLMYLNIYTPQFLGGEIRGQLWPVTTSVPEPETAWIPFLAAILLTVFIRRQSVK